MPGIIRSVTSTDPGSRRISSSAAPPDPAVSTRSDSRSRIFCSESTIPGSSSTPSTVGSPARTLAGAAAPADESASFVKTIPGPPLVIQDTSTAMPTLAEHRKCPRSLVTRLRQVVPGRHPHAKLTNCLPGRWAPCHFVIRPLRRGGRQRQPDAKHRPLAGAALGADAAAVAFDDAVNDGEAQARALAHVLGGEERIEDARQDLGGDTGAVVGHRDLRVGAVTPHADLDQA